LYSLSAEIHTDGILYISTKIISYMKTDLHIKNRKKPRNA